jgi:hypothetical protein
MILPQRFMSVTPAHHRAGAACDTPGDFVERSFLVERLGSFSSSRQPLLLQPGPHPAQPVEEN